MAHIRSQVRAYVAELIKGSALVGNRVDIGRSRPIGKNDPGRAFVYIPSETSEDLDTSGTQNRLLRIKIDVPLKGAEEDSLDDLDGFALFVELAFAADRTLGGLVSDNEYSGTDVLPNMDGEKPFTVMSLTFRAAILTNKTDPETAL